MKDSYKINSVTIENFMRVRFARVDFNGQSVVIGGENGAGKSSVAKAILVGFCGKKELPEQPVRVGAEESNIMIELDGDLVLKANILPDRTYKIELMDKQGGKYRSPQQKLDEFNVHYGYYPQDFLEMSPKEQVDTLLKLTGLDLEAFDRKRQTLFERRTEVNRELKRLEVSLQGAEFYTDAPAEEQSASALLTELQVSRGIIEDHEKLLSDAARYEAEAKNCERKIDELESQIRKYRESISSYRKNAKEATALAESVKLPDIEAIEERILSVDGLNQKVRANREHQKFVAAIKEAQSQSEKLTGAIEQVDKDKAESVAAAAFPVSGLGFSEQGVTLNGLPLNQASDAEQWTAAIAIGFAMKPKLRLVYVRNGSLLTEKTRKLVYDITEKNGGQLLFEVAGDAPDVTVLMEDGEVKETRAAGQATGGKAKLKKEKIKGRDGEEIEVTHMENL